MVGNSLVEVDERIRKSVSLVFNKAQKGLTDTNYGCEIEKTFWFCDLYIYTYFQDSQFIAVKRNAKL